MRKFFGFFLNFIELDSFVTEILDCYSQAFNYETKVIELDSFLARFVDSCNQTTCQAKVFELGSFVDGFVYCYS